MRDKLSGDDMKRVMLALPKFTQDVLGNINTYIELSKTDPVFLDYTLEHVKVHNLKN